MPLDIDKFKSLCESPLFHEGPIVLFIWDNSENWPVISVSENVARIFGHAPTAFISGQLQYASLIHEEDISRVFEEVTHFSSQGDITTFSHQPYRLKCADESYKWVHDSTLIIRDGEKITHYIGYISDISEFKALEALNKKRSEELLEYQALLESYKVAIDESSIVTKTDIKGVITYANENFYKVSGLSKEKVIGKTHAIIRHKDNPSSLYKELWETILAKKVWKGILKNRSVYGPYWVDLCIVPILDIKGDISEFIAIRHDVTQMILQKAKLDEAINTDLLTGLGSRYKLNHDIVHSDNPILAIVDIDDFSQINDFYGHEKGDEVIKGVGEIFVKFLNSYALKIYHLQGDEFVFLGSNYDCDAFLETMNELADLIAIKQAISIGDDEIFVRVSIGVSTEDRDKLLSSADMALKVAKRDRKMVVHYNQELSLNQEYKNNLHWTHRLKIALENDAITPVYQCIVNNITQKVEKFESLVRMIDDGELVSPYHFLEISKQTKYYSSITKVMLEKTFEYFKNREEEFSINLTVEDIRNVSTCKYIITLLQRYSIGQRVVFEIVESESIENVKEVVTFIQEVKAFGCKIAIDDFGTGYSNFNYLLQLKADIIKIDGSLIKNIVTSKDTQAIVSFIVEFAKKMGMQTIAEFVEDEEIYNSVKALGVDYSQGYYFCKPKLSI